MKALVIILSVHIFSVHTKLLYYLNPDNVDKLTFSFGSINEQTMLSMIFALAYSIATAIVIYHTSNKRMIILYAILDGAGVLLYYFPMIPMAVSAFYFAFYTFILIASTLAFKKPEKQLSFSKMYKKGKTLQDIADIRGVSVETAIRQISKNN